MLECHTAKMRGLGWWMHFHEDSRPKEEGDQVAFKGINQKGKRRQGTCLLLLLLYAFCFSLSPAHHSHAPITMHHLACSTFFNYLQKQDKQ